MFTIRLVRLSSINTEIQRPEHTLFLWKKQYQNKLILTFFQLYILYQKGFCGDFRNDHPVLPGYL